MPPHLMTMLATLPRGIGVVGILLDVVLIVKRPEFARRNIESNHRGLFGRLGLPLGEATYRWNVFMAWLVGLGAIVWGVAVLWTGS